MNQQLIPNPLVADKLPSKLDILFLNDLAYRLGVSRGHLDEVTAIAGRYYRPFEKKNRPRWFAREMPKPKRRIIDNPVDDLKDLQRRIERRLLKPLVYPSYLCGGIKGRTVIDNVSMHIGTRVLVTVDIKSFFPSIRPSHVYKTWREILGCSPDVSAVLTRITTFERHLPQGAPSSTLLANLVLFSVDEPIRAACRDMGVTYSTWVDDLAFSGSRAPEIIQTAVDALRSAGFRISHRKLKIMGTGGRMILNGVLVGRFPGVVRERVDQLRSGIHKLRVGAVPDSLLSDYCRSLEGSIRQLATVVPRRTERLRKEFDEATSGRKFLVSAAP